jgi:hypothetical protein
MERSIGMLCRRRLLTILDARLLQFLGNVGLGVLLLLKLGSC